jgi:hypothetical protein
MLLALDTTTEILHLAQIGAGGMGEVPWENANFCHPSGDSLNFQSLNIGAGSSSLLESA